MVAVAITKHCAERDRNERNFGRRIGVRERAADGAARPRGRVTNPRHDLGEQGDFGSDNEIVLDDAMTRGGADRDRSAFVMNECEFRNAGDVDQQRRPGEPHGHQGNERLPSGDEARAVVGGKDRASLVEVCRGLR